MSVPDRLWFMLRDWNLLKRYMDCVITCFNEFFSKMTCRKLKVGVIVFLHPFGKDVKSQPHFYIFLTEGGFDQKKNFVPCKYVPVLKFKKKLQYEVLKMLQAERLPDTVATEMYHKYPKRFYVRIPKK